MKCITVLLTCVGNGISISQINCLKNNGERKIRIIGTDMENNSVGKYFVDKFYQVPAGNDAKYAETILDICRREKVDVVLPASNEESEALSKNKKKFAKSSIVVAVSDYDTFMAGYNKGLFYEKLKNNKIPCAEFGFPKNKNEFIKISERLGYPKHPVVFKPFFGRGGRGVKILVNRKKGEFFSEKPGYLEHEFDDVLEKMKPEDFKDTVLMEHLPGDIVSVDMLCDNGKILYIIPKLRVKGNASQSLFSRVIKDERIEKMASDIVKLFGFSYNVNFEMAFSRNNSPMVFDLHARIAASTGVCAAAGANIIYYAVKMALGESIPKTKIKHGLLIARYFNELYIDCDKKFEIG